VRVVYLDDCASGTTVFGNIFYQATRSVIIGGGRDNRIENNIFLDTEPGIRIDDRCIIRAKCGVTWTRAKCGAVSTP
jgi:parallel beta-helix repeat protein